MPCGPPRCGLSTPESSTVFSEIDGMRGIQPSHTPIDEYDSSRWRLWDDLLSTSDHQPALRKRS